MVRTMSVLLVLFLTGCAADLPRGSDVMVLHWSATRAITEQQAAGNNDMRIALWQAWKSGQSAEARKPMATIEGDPMDYYLVTEDGAAQLIIDSRRDRYAGERKIHRYEVTSMRLGYLTHGRFTETQDPPPDGREMVLLVRTADNREFRF